jgi:propanol-preferring alcohol dehydrogenase
VKAVQLVGWESEPELRDVEPPEPGPGQVLVKVDAAGLCHSDLHVMEWPEGTFPWKLPMTLGHETAGTVAAVGDGVRNLEEGAPVLVYGPWGCGACPQCARGAENICERRPEQPGRGCGLGFESGLAARIVALDMRESARTHALGAGADVALDATALDAADLRSETGGGAALALDFVGSDDTVRLGASAIASGGHVSILGLGGSTFPMAHGTVPLEWSAGRPSWGTLPELHEVVALARAGRIELEVERIGIAETIAAYRRLRDGKVNGRVVVVL